MIVFDTTTAAALVHGAILFVPEGRLVTIQGVDSVRYLHARTTQDLKSLAVGNGVEALILTSTGRAVARVTIFRNATGFLLLSDLETDAELEKFLKLLLQFRVADQVVAEISNSEIYSIQGKLADEIAKVLLGKIPPRFHIEELPKNGGTMLFYPRGPHSGFDLLSPSEEILSAVRAVSGVVQVEASVSEVLRILGGLPKSGVELTEQTLGPELDTSRFVSFTKGCYTGQEVMEMATARGRVNRSLSLVHSSHPLEIGTAIYLGANKIGEVTSSLVFESSGAGLSLAFLKQPLDPSLGLVASAEPVRVIAATDVLSLC